MFIIPELLLSMANDHLLPLQLYAGRTAHVMTFEVGAVLEDTKWQAPVYCFEKKTDTDTDTDTALPKADIGSMRLDGIPRGSIRLPM